jgi:hypothetical protein
MEWSHFKGTFAEKSMEEAVRPSTFQLFGGDAAEKGKSYNPKFN